MDLYEVINGRRTVRQWENRDVSPDALRRIIDAGIKAPSNNHLREWEFIILREDKEKVLRFVKEWETEKSVAERLKAFEDGSIRHSMYAYAFSRQYSMLKEAPYVIIPLFKLQKLSVQHINELNPLASVWCVIENILLASTAEGLGCAIRIPVGNEEEKVRSALNVPDGYRMPCYIGVGYPKQDAFQPEQTAVSADEKMHLEKW